MSTLQSEDARSAPSALMATGKDSYLVAVRIGRENAAEYAGRAGFELRGAWVFGSISADSELEARLAFITTFRDVGLVFNFRPQQVGVRRLQSIGSASDVCLK
jgi:hypothetical protein